MAEGRKMFQLFAARLFEQRVLSAFRQRIADERQKALLEELEEEKSHDVQREAKKQRDAQKRKEKKQQQKQAKAEEKARKEAEKRAEEEAAKALEAQKQEEQRKKKEEQRKKKELERKAQEEERLKKEAEKLRRQQEERERQQEVERKAREQKAQEKKARDDARRKEREEREAKEREAKEKKAHADKQRKERDEKIKAEKEAQEKLKRETQAAQNASSTQSARRSGQSAAPPTAVPPLQRNPSGFPSPHVAVATPVVPKAPTPVRARPGSKVSSPKTPQVQAGIIGKSGSPLDQASQQQPAQRKTVLPKVTQPAQLPQTNPLTSSSHTIPLHDIPAPPGFGLPMANGMQPGQMRTQRPMFPMSSQANSQFRQTGPMSIPPAPPGMIAPGMQPMAGVMFPPGLQHTGSNIGATNPPPGFGAVGRDIPISHPTAGHGRQASGSSGSFDHSIGNVQPQPVQRPAPIGRPSSVKPQDDSRLNYEINDITAQLGSKALLDELDEPLPNDPRRPPPGPHSLPRASSSNLSSAFGASPIFTQANNQQRMDAFPLGTAGSTGGSWGATTPSTLPFGQGPLSPAGPWASPGTGGWPSAATPGAPGNLPGLGIAGGSSLGTMNRSRPVLIRTTVCQIFQRFLTGNLPGAVNKHEGWQDISTIARYTEQLVKPPVSIREILDILDTEGNEHNGGGTFSLQSVPGSVEHTLVRWNPPNEGKSVGAIGEIGSPGGIGLGTGVPTSGGPPPGLMFPGLGAHHTGGFH
jgi:actin-related protein